MKGYMVYVEGMNKPDVIHGNYTVAATQAHGLARKCPEKEVFLFRLHKRIKYNTEGKYEKLPTHSPDQTPEGGLVRTQHLKFRDE